MGGNKSFDILLRYRKVQREGFSSDSGYQFRQVPAAQLECLAEASLRNRAPPYRLLQPIVQLPVQDELWQAVRSWTPAWQLEFGDLVDYLTPPSPQAAGLDLDLDTSDHDAGIPCISGTGR